jgi:hypothetical protein
MSKQKLKRRINRLENTIKTVRINNMTIAELMKQDNIKGESFDINAIENGFFVKFGYRQRPEDNKEASQDYNWSYKSKSYVFTSWADAVKFLGENELPQPPK